MEGTVVGSVVNTVVGSLVENLISKLKREFSKIGNVERDVAKLVSTLSTIQAVLEDAEEKQINNKPISNWLRKLKDLTYDADDVLDAWSLKIQHELQSASTSSTSQFSCSLPGTLNLKEIRFYGKIAKEIKKIITTFDEIAVQKSQFHLNTSAVLQSESPFNKERETTSVVTESHIYGRDENKLQIIDLLVNDFVNQESVSICSIVGMGGLGKTSLVQSIYNDEAVQRHFLLEIWVCVSQPFDVRRVLKAIIEPFDTKACDFLTLEFGRRKVEEILRGKRYLIVLDDVWNEVQDEWNSLKSFLKGGAKGSSIILTTRSPIVASMTGTIPPYCLGALSNEDCFSLFMNRALSGMGKEENPTLIEIGMEIAEKCKGIPLVAKSLGSLLRFKTNEKQWNQIKESEIWTLSETGENTILAALRLSYNHLPSRLKQCFAYYSIFPKGSIWQRSKLIYSWIANGFIQSHGMMEVEEVGDGIFNELVQLSFFEASEKDNYGNVETTKMHDLMHDLACYVSRNESFTAKIGKTKHIPDTIKHLLVVYDSPQSSTDLNHLFSSKPSLRSLFFGHSIDFHRFRFFSTLRVLDLSWRSLETLPPSLWDLKHLRYLDLSNNLLSSLPESIHRLKNLQMLDVAGNERITTLPHSVCKLENLRYLDASYCSEIRSLPKSIYRLKNLRSLNLSGNRKITALPPLTGNLEHLRYLNLSYCDGITSLPESISQLTNLQWLLVRVCNKLKMLPENMGRISSLRHLDISGYYRLNKMPVGIGQLRCLETLTDFVVGRPSDGDSEGGGASISELHGLNQLRGRLRIQRLENVRNAEDAKEANLTTKRHLSKLAVRWGNDDSLEVNNSKEVLEGLLQLPANLQELEIFNYKWEACFPKGFAGNLNTLRSVEIKFCTKLKSLPIELENLKGLRSLIIQGCQELVSLTEGLLQKLTSLEALRIWECTSLNSLGLMLIQGRLNPSSSRYESSLKELEIWGCPELVLSEEDFQQLSALHELILVDLPQLTTLPQGIQHLLVLRHLQIRGCSNLRMFPEWMKHLTALQSLKIYDCHPDLNKRCEKDKGEDWHLISQIPNLIINWLSNPRTVTNAGCRGVDKTSDRTSSVIQI